jgi:hypothetical protein
LIYAKSLSSDSGPLQLSGVLSKRVDGVGLKMEGLSQFSETSEAVVYQIFSVSLLSEPIPSEAQ